MNPKTQLWEVVGQLQTSADFDDFLCALDVWIRRPHVINKRLLGASILQEQEGESGSQITGRNQNHAGSRQLVREVITRKDVSTIRELVTIDEDAGTCSFSFLAPSGLLLTLGGGYQIRYEFPSPGERARVILAVLHAGGDAESVSYAADGVVAPTVKWLADVLLPKIVRWSEENQTMGGKVVCDPLVPLDKFGRLYSELKKKYGPYLVENWTETTDPQKFVYEDIAIATYLLLLWKEERDRLGLERRQSFVDLGCGNGLLVHLLTSEGHPGKGIDVRARKIWMLYGPSTHLEVCSLTPSYKTCFSGYDWIIGNHSDELTPWIPVIAARSSYTAKYFVLPCCSWDFDKRFTRVGCGQSQYHSYLDYVKMIGAAMGFEVEEDIMRIPSSKRVCHIGRRRLYPHNEESEIDAKRKEFIDSRSSCTVVASPLYDGHNQSSPVISSKADSGPETVAIDASYGVAKLSGSEGSSRASGGEGSSGASGGESSLGASGGKGSSLASSLLDGGGPKEHFPQDGCGSVKECGASEQWLPTFKPRPPKERPRNCSHIDPKIKALIVNTVAFKLLSEENYVDIPVVRDDEDSAIGGSCGWQQWNVGGKLHLNVVAALFDAKVLLHLKQEFGGLQTVFRNHRQVFKVTDSHVQIRDWWKDEGTKRLKDVGKATRMQKTLVLPTKTKECWFHAHHPQGCPRPSFQCSFAHGIGDLKTP